MAATGQLWRKTLPDGTMINIGTAEVYYVAEDAPGVWRIHVQGAAGGWALIGDFATHNEAQSQLEADLAALSE